MVAPAMGAPSDTSPTTVTVSMAPERTTVVVSPTARPEDSRVADSSAISPAPLGA